MLYLLCVRHGFVGGSAAHACCTRACDIRQRGCGSPSLAAGASRARGHYTRAAEQRRAPADTVCKWRREGGMNGAMVRVLDARAIQMCTRRCKGERIRAAALGAQAPREIGGSAAAPARGAALCVCVGVGCVCVSVFRLETRGGKRRLAAARVWQAASFCRGELGRSCLCPPANNQRSLLRPVLLKVCVTRSRCLAPSGCLLAACCDRLSDRACASPCYAPCACAHMCNRRVTVCE
jgi:hypothetical protein